MTNEEKLIKINVEIHGTVTQITLLKEKLQDLIRQQLRLMQAKPIPEITNNIIEQANRLEENK